MKSLALLLFVLGVPVVAAACSRQKPAAPTEPETQPPPMQQQAVKPTAKNGLGTFTIGKATTYVTGPLAEHGHTDYAAAQN